jgi:hypothetical protein
VLSVEHEKRETNHLAAAQANRQGRLVVLSRITKLNATRKRLLALWTNAVLRERDPVKIEIPAIEHLDMGVVGAD